MYHDQGKLDDALRMYERCLEVEQAIYGEECAHPDIATSLNNFEGVENWRTKLEGELCSLRIRHTSLKNRNFYSLLGFGLCESSQT